MNAHLQLLFAAWDFTAMLPQNERHGCSLIVPVTIAFLLIGAIFVSVGDAEDQPVPGANPIIRDVFTADPAPLVVGDTVYLYVGHDNAKGCEMLTMSEWLCYSSKDMKSWTSHGPVLRPTDFTWGEPNSAWAAQVVPKDGKFYYYVTVKGNRTAPGNNVGVAVADSPTGPFKDAIGKPLDFNPDGTIKPITQTETGVSVLPQK